MSHFAEIDNNNKVIRVVVVPDEFEFDGQKYLADDLGMGGTWIQTSYNAKIRGKFAGIGDTYDLTADRFIVASPFKSWKLNENFEWSAPKPYPNDEKPYQWNEKKLAWVEVVSVS